MKNKRLSEKSANNKKVFHSFTACVLYIVYIHVYIRFCSFVRSFVRAKNQLTSFQSPNFASTNYFLTLILTINEAHKKKSIITTHNIFLWNEIHWRFDWKTITHETFCAVFRSFSNLCVCVCFSSPCQFDIRPSRAHSFSVSLDRSELHSKTFPISLFSLKFLFPSCDDVLSA